jgi:hypothetical protein
LGPQQAVEAPQEEHQKWLLDVMQSGIHSKSVENIAFGADPATKNDKFLTLEVGCTDKTFVV